MENLFKTSNAVKSGCVAAVALCSIAFGAQSTFAADTNVNVTTGVKVVVNNTAPRYGWSCDRFGACQQALRSRTTDETDDHYEDHSTRHTEERF